MECNSFGSGLEAMLMQENQLIVFYSKHLKGKALLLSTYERELLTLVNVVSK